MKIHYKEKQFHYSIYLKMYAKLNYLYYIYWEGHMHVIAK